MPSILHIKGPHAQRSIISEQQYSDVRHLLSGRMSAPGAVSGTATPNSIIQQPPAMVNLQSHNAQTKQNNDTGHTDAIAKFRPLFLILNRISEKPSPRQKTPSDLRALCRGTRPAERPAALPHTPPTLVGPSYGGGGEGGSQARHPQGRASRNGDISQPRHQ